MHNRYVVQRLQFASIARENAGAARIKWVSRAACTDREIPQTPSWTHKPRGRRELPPALGLLLLLVREVREHVAQVCDAREPLQFVEAVGGDGALDHAVGV